MNDADFKQFAALRSHKQSPMAQKVFWGAAIKKNIECGCERKKKSIYGRW